MEQRKSARRRSSDGTSNRNMRSINNSREVSRRAKGKDRYAYEEDRRTSGRYYDDEEDYYRERPRKKSSSANKRKQENEYQNQRRAADTGSSRKCNNKRRRGRKKNRVSRTIGIILTIIQFILSVVLAVNVMLFNVLTSTYF